MLFFRSCQCFLWQLAGKCVFYNGYQLISRGVWQNALYKVKFESFIADLEAREDAAKTEKESDEIAAKNLEAEVSFFIVISWSFILSKLLIKHKLFHFYICCSD